MDESPKGRGSEEADHGSQAHADDDRPRDGHPRAIPRSAGPVAINGPDAARSRILPSSKPMTKQPLHAETHYQLTNVTPATVPVKTRQQLLEILASCGTFDVHPTVQPKDLQ